MRILLVEDEDNIRDTVRLNLEMEGYEVVTASKGRQAQKILAEQHFDLLLFDVMLPEVDGFSLAESVRLTNQAVPILFLTAKDQAADRIMGLKKGGDDYLTKPFNLEELLLRVSKLLQRSARAAGPVADTVEFGGNFVNFSTFEATTANGPLKLTKKEALLLKLLVDRKGEVVSRNQILQAVWGYDVFPSTRTIDNFILSFRKYFEADQKNPRFFHAIRGVGYKFSPDVQAD